MSAPSDDDTDPELRKYAPKWSREQPATPTAERLRQVSTSASAVPSSREEYQDRRIRPLWPGPVPEPPARQDDGLRGLIGRFVNVAAVAALVAALVIFGKPLLQRVGVLEPDSPPTQISKPSDPLIANDAPANRALVPAAGIAAAPAATPSATAQAQAPLSSAQGQQAALSPTSKPLGQDSSASSAFRGVTDGEISFGISAPFTGAAKELGQNMKRGIETAFNVANAKGGVYGRQLRLIAADDGYE
ncbi:MAG TPA: ABC transporter substrate-binding protein, partial [Terriglobales bacterium]|nr:ABC transporter substrate-binding protein [Terriglobales bacterium]